MALEFVCCSSNRKPTTPFTQLGFCFSDFVYKRPTLLDLKICYRRNWECLSYSKITPVQDDIPSTCPPVVVEESTQTSLPRVFHKDLNFLPKPLSATQLFSCSSGNGTKIRVAFQGVRGACSESAALKAYPRCETVPCDKFEAAFEAVELRLVDKAIVPIENSVDGSIQHNYDLLVRHKLNIVGEVQLIVDHCHCHCRLGPPRKDELNRVLSHPQDVRDNITRFLILAREPIIPTTDRPHKTSIVFTLEEGAGVLFKALAVFALRDINLSKIESRPHIMQPLRASDDTGMGSTTYFDYLFYLDFQASMAEPRAQNALRNLQEFTRFLRVLGCYPMDII